MSAPKLVADAADLARRVIREFEGDYGMTVGLKEDAESLLQSLAAAEETRAPAVPESALAALLGKRVTVYLWIRAGFLHYAADLFTTGRGDYHLAVVDRLSPRDGPLAGAVFTAADVETIGAFPNGGPLITLKAEGRK